MNNHVRLTARSRRPLRDSYAGLANAARSRNTHFEKQGGDDLRDRKSTTLVVAWMSPPVLEIAQVSQEMKLGLVRARAAARTAVCTVAWPGR